MTQPSSETHAPELASARPGDAGLPGQVTLVPAAALRAGVIQPMPALTDQELAALRASIQASGVLQPVEAVDTPDGLVVVDGNHRTQIAADLGIPVPVRILALAGQEQMDYARQVNATRRHLTAAQRRYLIRQVLAEDPGRADRDAARLCGCDHKTVAAVRAGMADAGEIPQRPAKQQASTPDAVRKRRTRAAAQAAEPDHASTENAPVPGAAPAVAPPPADRYPGPAPEAARPATRETAAAARPPAARETDWEVPGDAACGTGTQAAALRDEITQLQAANVRLTSDLHKAEQKLRGQAIAIEQNHRALNCAACGTRVHPVLHPACAARHGEPPDVPAAGRDEEEPA